MRHLVLAAAVASLVLSAPALAQAVGDLAGSWRLEEQYYGSGQRNFVSSDSDLSASFWFDADRLAGRLTVEGHTAAWPAYFGPDGARPIEAVATAVDPDRRGARASYRVLPAPGDDTYLLVTETLRLRDDGRLACDVEIAFERNGERKGGFTWRRVFAREGAR